MVIYPESFNIKPDSEVTVAFSNLLNTASENANPKSLLLQKGNYVFLSKYAQERELYITNTIADKEYSETDKKHIHKIALDLKGINDLEIDFNNSTIILDGKMTNIVIENCENITLKNLTIETVQPNVHKITILKASPFYVTFKIDETSNYKKKTAIIIGMVQIIFLTLPKIKIRVRGLLQRSHLIIVILTKMVHIRFMVFLLLKRLLREFLRLVILYRKILPKVRFFTSFLK